MKIRQSNKYLKAFCKEEIDDVEIADRFKNAVIRLKAAHWELAMAQKNLMEFRKQLRSEGHFEPDSLLYLSDGEDDHIMSTVMEFLTVEEAGRCELVCKVLKRVAKYSWDEFDRNLLTSQQSPSALNTRERVKRCLLASNLAKRIGGIGQDISKHLCERYLHADEVTIGTRRVHGCCEGCDDFPEELNFDALRKDAADDFELFIRFSRTNDNYTFAEGFLPFIYEGILVMPLKNLDFSKWIKIREVSQLAERYKEEEELNNDDLLHECMNELTVTVVAINKTSSRESLVFTLSDFTVIENKGDHGFCFPDSVAVSRSHGENLGNGTTITVGMFFKNVVRANPTDTSRVSAVECQWGVVCKTETSKLL